MLTVFKDRVDPSHTTPIVDAFEEGLVVHTGEDLSSDHLATLVAEVPALRAPVSQLTPNDSSPAALAAAAEFVLEGLHLSKRLNKDTSGTHATYTEQALNDYTSGLRVQSSPVSWRTSVGAPCKRTTSIVPGKPRSSISPYGSAVTPVGADRGASWASARRSWSRGRTAGPPC